MLSEETIPACSLFPKASSLPGMGLGEYGCLRRRRGRGEKIVGGSRAAGQQTGHAVFVFLNSKNILHWGMPIKNVVVVSGQQ